MFKKTPQESGDAFALALDNQPLSIGTAVLVTVIAVPICATAFYVNRDYAVANLIILQLDEASLAVRKLSIDLFLSTDVAAFFIIALLIGQKYKYWRWKLFVLGVVIWAFDCATIYQARFGIMLASQNVSTKVTNDADDNKKTIERYRLSADSWMATAAEQRQRGQIKKGAESQAFADEALKAAEKLQPVKSPMDNKKAAVVTEVQIWGSEKLAKYKAFIESVVISLIKLFMSGLSGAMIRAMRERLFYNKLASAAPAPSPALGQPVASASTSFKPAGTVIAPKNFSGLSYSTKLGVGALGALGAMTAPMTHAVPAPVKVAPIPSGGGINVDTPLSSLTPLDPQRGINVDTPSKARKARVARDGLPMDSGIGAHDGYRYRRALAGVQAHTIRPSLSGLYEGVGATADVARRFLAEMARVGEIVRNSEDTAWIPALKKAVKKPAKKSGAA